MDDAVTRFLPVSPKDYLVMFALSAGERHGYGLVKDVEAQSDGAVRLDPSNLYRSLRKLIKDGLVQETGQDDRRCYYAITGLGRRVVAAEARRLARLTRAARERRLIPRTERP